MSNATYFKAYVPMGTTMDMGKEVPEEMEVEVYYTLGGANYFNGGTTRRGIYVSFTPVRRSKTSVTRTLMDDRGRKLLLQELRAKSDKSGRHWAEIIRHRKDDLAKAAIAQDWPEVARLATETARPSETAPRGWDKVEGGAAA